MATQVTKLYLGETLGAILLGIVHIIVIQLG